MKMVALNQSATATRIPEASRTPDLSADPRWQLVERIAQSEPFQKSSKLPALLCYLARCTITDDRHGLTEQMIGKAVFGKPKDYTPAEDSSVRVYVRHLRLRLHEYYQVSNRNELLVVSLPKGGYGLTFTSVAAPMTGKLMVVDEQSPGSSHRPVFPRYTSLFLLALAICCAVGWYRTATGYRYRTPWPLNQVISRKSQTTVVLSDAGYSLRMLGNREVPLDQYIDRSFLAPILPKHMTEGEVRLIHYFEVSRLTSLADAHATAALSALAAPYAQNLIIRSAKNINSNDLSHGNFIFVGAKSSNPWVEIFDDQLNFQFVEDSPGGSRYIVNRKPQPGENTKYLVPENTGASGQDYATIALLPAKNGSGKVLLIQGLRLEGTEAAIELLRNEDQRLKLRQKLASANRNRTPVYFEILLRAQSVAGSPVSMDIIAVRTGA